MSEWRKCSSCKKPIMLNSRYYVCSVSTCNSQRTGYVFCSVPCFEVHLPSARHKDAAAIEMRSPARLEERRIVPSPAAALTSSASQGASTQNRPSPTPKEILIIASRLKEYIQAKGDMNTSAQVMDILSDKVRALCDQAIEKARTAGRKTVMDRDF